MLLCVFSREEEEECRPVLDFLTSFPLLGEKEVRKVNEGLSSDRLPAVFRETLLPDWPAWLSVL